MLALLVDRDDDTRRPLANVRRYLLVPNGNLGEGDRGVQPAEDGNHLLALHQLARDGDALLRIALVVADDELELPATEHAALGVDLVDGNLQPPLDGLARSGRAAGDGGGEPDLDGLLGLGERRSRRGERDGQE